MGHRSESTERKPLDVVRAVNYLNRAFQDAVHTSTHYNGNKVISPFKGTQKIGEGSAMYQYQVTFCHLIDNLQRGPVYIAPKLITEINELIERVKTHRDPTE